MLGARPGKREIINGKDAFQMITMHFQFNHPQPHVVHGAPHHQLGVGGQCKTEKDPRPTLAREDKYVYFHRLWLRCIRGAHMMNGDT